MMMTIDLNAEEVELLLAALSYSTRGVRGADGTPPFIRQQQIESLDQLHRKFQEVARGEADRRE